MRIAVSVTCTLLATTMLLVPPTSGAEAAATQARVTIFARPTVVRWTESAMLFGSISSRQGGDIVAIQGKDCGSSFFRTYVEAHTFGGGGWSTPVGTGITTTFRAVWRGVSSPPVTVRQGANVGLERRRSGKGFLVAVSGKRSFWRRQVQIQRRVGGAWRIVKTVVLTESVRSTGTVSVSRASFSLAVPKGAQLRALLPLSQAKPCYVQSVSRILRA